LFVLRLFSIGILHSGSTASISSISSYGISVAAASAFNTALRRINIGGDYHYAFSINISTVNSVINNTP